MLISSTSLEQANNTKNFLSSKFTMKDKGIANVILGIRIHRENNNLILLIPLYRKDFRKLDSYNFAIVSTLHLIFPKKINFL